jgi:opacity protein-like surface antigen
MKTLPFFLLTLALMPISVWSKTSSQNKFAEHKHNINLSIGYGVPSILRLYLKQNTNRQELMVSGYGPLMAKLDYMISNRFSVGVNASYSYTQLAWMDDGYDPAIHGNRPYEYGIRASELSGTIRGNYHYLRRSKFDAYAGFGFGYGRVSLSTYTLAPMNQFYVRYNFPRPYSGEITTGLRYFPISRVGIYTEIGIGKSWLLFNHFIPEALIQMGVTVKFL